MSTKSSLHRETISNLFVLLAVAISIYLFTFATNNLVILFPALLISSAIGLQWYLGKYKKGGEIEEDWVVEQDLTGKRINKDIYYSVIAIAGMLATSLFVGYISYTGLGLSITNAVLFGILMAVAETLFFQGVIFNYLLNDIVHHPTIAMLGGAIVAMIFHLAVYGGSNASLIYVFIGFFILNFVTYKSGSLTAAMTGHSVNNCLAAVGLVSVSQKFIAATILMHLPKLVLHI